MMLLHFFFATDREGVDLTAEHKKSSSVKSDELEICRTANRFESNFTLTYLLPRERDRIWHLHINEW